MLKRLASFILAISFVFSCFVLSNHTIIKTSAATNASVYNLVDDVQDGQILQCWNWSFDNIRDNMAKIAEQGFSAIQTSPIQASKESTKESWSTASNAFWVYYQPINFSIETNSRSALGTKSDFEDMCDEAHKYGIKVIVDTVFNHLANNNSDNSLSTQIPSDIKDDSGCWHSVHTNISNYSDRYDITHHCLAGLPDLNTGNSKIQNYAIDFLKECIDAGADGFRFDAAKHIETPSDYSGTSSDFWPNVLDAATTYAESTRGITPYYYGEILDSPGGVDISAYTKYMSVTDNSGSNSIRNAVNSSNASGAANSAIFNGAEPKYTVQWNESHDTYSEGSSDYVSNTNLKKTWAIVGARAEVCGMYLARPSSGSTKLGAADVTAWADNEVKEINLFKNSFVGQSEYLASSGNIAYIERGTSGVVLVNVSGKETSVNVTANRIASGTYTDAISGNTFTVSNGKISGNIGSTGIAVVYNKSEVIIPTEPPTEAPTEAPTKEPIILSGEKQTVYVGVVKYITEPQTLHYWNDNGLEGDAQLVSTGLTGEFAVGDDYWSNNKKLYYIYTAEIPVEATHVKTFTSETGDDWAEEKVSPVEGKIVLVFEYSNLYHNVLVDYVVTEEPEVDKIENILTSPSATNMGFTWDAKENASKYWVYKYNIDTDTWSSAASSYTNSAVVKLLDADTEYQFKVICKYNDNSIISLDDADIITVKTAPPVATDKIEASAGITEATVSWNAIDGATKYWVYKATNENGPFYIYSSAYDTTLTVRKLRPDTTYYFKVVGFTYNNGIPTISKPQDSPMATVTTDSGSKITTSCSSVTSNSATVSWPAFENADKYWLLYSTTTNNPELSAEWTSVKSTTDLSNLNYTFSNLDNNKTYYLNVCARYTDENGNVMTINYIPVQIRTYYADEQFVKFTKVNDTAVTLTLPDDLDIQKAWIYVYDEDGNKVSAVSTTSTSATINSLSDPENYKYAIYVLDNNGKYGYITPQTGYAYK